MLAYSLLSSIHVASALFKSSYIDARFAVSQFKADFNWLSSMGCAKKRGPLFSHSISTIVYTDLSLILNEYKTCCRVFMYNFMVFSKRSPLPFGGFDNIRRRLLSTELKWKFWPETCIQTADTITVTIKTDIGDFCLSTWNVLLHVYFSVLKNGYKIHITFK